jgi:predicted RNA-binding Zn-ribbon protein involved in translation (DUF1610 family)
MAKKKGGKRLEAQIKELAAVVAESNTCGACGKPIGADATTCPQCGTPVGEAAELHETAEESLMDLEKHLAETAEEPAPKRHEPESPAKGGLESAAAIVAAVQVSEPVPAPAPIAPVARIAPEPVPETGAEFEESEELEGFIEEIEAEVGPGKAELPATPKVASVPRTPTVPAVHRATPSSRSGRWVAPVAAGLVLYVLGLFLLALLGRLVVATFMILGTFLVFAGIRARPVSGAGPRGGPGSRAEDYVCPLCGTEIPARATQCPTCGAIFEE